MKATLGYGASTCSYTDWLDADLIVLLRLERRQQPAGHDEVPAPREAARRAGRGRQPVSRARARRATGCRRSPSSAVVRHAHRRPLVRRAHRRRPRVPRRRAARADRARAASTRRSSRERTDRLRRGARRARWPPTGTRSSARAARRASGCEALRAAADRPAERDLRLVDGPDAARARRRDGQGAGERRARARPARPARIAAWCRSAATRACRAAPRSAACPASTPRRARALGRGLGLRPCRRRRAGPTPEMIDRARRRRRRRCSGSSAATSSRRCPTRPQPRARCARPRLRIHQDIVLSSSMLVDGDGDVLLLPATTRYESPGGGTETSTERRIIFSPEIPGRRIGSARPEWWVFREVMARARPGARRICVGFEDAAAIRARDRARRAALRRHRAAVGARATRSSGAAARLYADGRFATADGKAHFAPVALRGRALPADARSSSRRGAASSSTRWCSATSIR